MTDETTLADAIPPDEGSDDAPIGDEQEPDVPVANTDYAPSREEDVP